MAYFRAYFELDFNTTPNWTGILGVTDNTGNTDYAAAGNLAYLSSTACWNSMCTNLLYFGQSPTPNSALTQVNVTLISSGIYTFEVLIDNPFDEIDTTHTLLSQVVLTTIPRIIPFSYYNPTGSSVLVLNTDTTPNKNGTGTFIETTLAYSGTNTTGWGTPNPELTDATEATLTIYLPNTTTLLPDSTTSVVINLFTEGFPNTDYTPYILTNEALGGDAGTRIPDGIYQFDYLVYVNDTDAYTHSSYVMFDSDVNCCIANLAENVDATKCGCGKAASKFEKASLALTAARFAMDCPNITNAAKNLLAAIEICDGCTNC